MLVRIDRPAFRLSVCGFDENRDLYVQVRAREVLEDADQSH